MYCENDCRPHHALGDDRVVETIRKSEPQGYKTASVYDAVAGRISVSGYISKQTRHISTGRDTASSSRRPLPPENVLFRSKTAPTRFAEQDIYFANEVNDISGLPDSDLLKALHTYTADFYSKTTPDKGLTDWKSLDGSALIALGIMAEELVQDMIGETGDLALTEGIPISPKNGQANKTSYLRRPSRKKRKVDKSGCE